MFCVCVFLFFCFCFLFFVLFFFSLLIIVCSLIFYCFNNKLDMVKLLITLNGWKRSVLRSKSL